MRYLCPNLWYKWWWATTRNARTLIIAYIGNSSLNIRSNFQVQYMNECFRFNKFFVFICPFYTMFLFTTQFKMYRYLKKNPSFLIVCLRYTKRGNWVAPDGYACFIISEGAAVISVVSVWSYLPKQKACLLSLSDAYLFSGSTDIFICILSCVMQKFPHSDTSKWCIRSQSLVVEIRASSSKDWEVVLIWKDWKIWQTDTPNQPQRLNLLYIHIQFLNNSSIVQ